MKARLRFYRSALRNGLSSGYQLLGAVSLAAGFSGLTVWQAGRARPLVLALIAVALLAYVLLTGAFTMWTKSELARLEAEGKLSAGQENVVDELRRYRQAYAVIRSEIQEAEKVTADWRKRLEAAHEAEIAREGGDPLGVSDFEPDPGDRMLVGILAALIDLDQSVQRELLVRAPDAAPHWRAAIHSEHAAVAEDGLAGAVAYRLQVLDDVIAERHPAAP